MRTSILKKAMLCICLLLALSYANAQTADSFYLQITHVFENMETNRVSSGFLRDYGLDFADVENFDGVQLSDTNFVYSNIWYDLYSSLFTYRFNSTASSFLLPDTVFDNIHSLKANTYIPLSLLLFRYDKFRDDAVTNNLLTVSGDQLYDEYVSGTWQDPYEQKNLFAVTTNREIFKDSSITFRLPSSLIFTNYTNIQTYEADFGDGNGWQTITPNNDITVNYADTGIVTISFRITLTTSQQFESRSKIAVYFNIESGQRPNSANRFFENTDFPISATAYHSGGTLQIHYSSANSVSHHITKPLIIAEGFDPWKLISNRIEDNTDFDYFWFFRNQYGSTLRTLLEDDYDIIYVDYNDGTDAIERNAALVVDAINQVNTWKAQAGSSEQNVVLGISMGGIVARYALRQMEINSQSHDARLFVSLDAPYLGANVPLGLQALNEHIANVKVKVGPLFGLVSYVNLTGGDLIHSLKIYSTPAAQEMLTYYLKINSSGTISMDNSVHESFVSTLNSMGYPSCRNVAVSNGSECAESLPFTPGTDYLRFAGHFNTTFLGSLLFEPFAYLIGFYTNFPQLLLGILPGKNSLKCNFKIKTTPSSGTAEVYNGKIWYEKKILWLINVNANLTQNSYTSPSGILPLDAYPGGQYDANYAAQQLVQNFNGDFGSSFWQQLLNALAQRGVDEYYLEYPTFTFTPTPHVLDIGLGSTLLSNGDYTTQYEESSPPSSPKNTPFDNFITAYFNGSTNNEEHTTIETRNGDWIAAELNSSGLVSDCSVFCGAAVQGSSSICSSDENYSLNITLPGGSSVSWSASPTGIVSLTPSGNTVSVSKITSGNVTLTAIISSGSFCGTIYLTKPITVGAAPSENTLTANYSTDGYSGYLSDINCLKTYNFPGMWSGDISLSDQVATSFAWSFVSKTPSNATVSISYTDPRYATVTAKPDGAKVTYRLTTSNDCGSYSHDYRFDANGNICGIEVERPSTDNSKDLTIAPNPTSESFFVSLKALKKTAGIQEIVIKNKIGLTVKRVIFKNNNASQLVNVKDLPTDVYMIQVFDGSKWFTAKLLKL